MKQSNSWFFSYAPFTIQLQIQGLANTEGQVLIAVHNSSDSFPNDSKKATKRSAPPTKDAKDKVVSMDGLLSGKHAIIGFHDLDSNYEMTKNWIGLPMEPFGTSNKPMFLAPSRFAPAEFELQQDLPEYRDHVWSYDFVMDRRRGPRAQSNVCDPVKAPIS